MAEPEVDDEDLFADLYDADEKQDFKDQIPAPAQPEPEHHLAPEAQSEDTKYGIEPDIGHDPSSFDAEAMDQTPANGAEYDSRVEQEKDGRADSPGIQMKEDGKMFIGGLNWETTDQSLHDYFSQFGEVHECTVMRDGNTGRSRGFGFLTFKDPKTVNTVMAKEHFLDGKIIDPKRAIPKDEQEKTAKIFVGGVSQDASEAQFTEFFDKFGRVIDATLMMDKDTGRPRGFGFVTFDSDSAVERVLSYQPLEILGKPIEVKRAQPRGKVGEDDDFSRGAGRGRGGNKFGGRDDRFGGGDNQMNQNQGQNQGQMGMNGMTPQMMAQYWQRMQQYFQMMQQQMMANAMGGMGQMNPQMMMQMQQMQQMQGGNGSNPNAMQNMNPAQMQQMMQMMNMQQGGGMGSMGGAGGGNAGGGGRPPAGPSSLANRGFSALEQNAFEQQKYEHQARRGGGAPSGPKGGSHHHVPQSWEGMYDDVPQPDSNSNSGSVGGGGGGGPRRNNTPLNGKAPKGPGSTGQPHNAPANAPTGPKNAGKPGANFRGGGHGRGRYHPYGR